jgi:excinuclease ABC subunit A
MAHFSFNKPAGACPTCSGLGVIHQTDLARLLDEQKSLLQAASAHYGLAFDLERAVKDYPQPQRNLLLFGVDSPLFRRYFPTIQPSQTVRQGRFEGIATSLLRRYAHYVHEHMHETGYRDQLEDFLLTRTCLACVGTGLRPESLAVTVDGAKIVALSCLPPGDWGARVQALPAALTPADMHLAASIARLVKIGPGYLTLSRPGRALSVGETQRQRPASLSGSELSGVLYMFDESALGLHQRDTHRLITVLRRLRGLGNTVLVIEHDLEVIAAADYVVDFGPGAGRHGGEVIAQGTPAELAKQTASLTPAYLVGRAWLPAARQRMPDDRGLLIRGARQHNLQNLTVRLPPALLVAVTGVSGAGKSSLAFDVLARAWETGRQAVCEQAASGYDAIEGYDFLDRLLSIDQNQIGRIPRSNIVTYAEAFAVTPEARRQGISARHFSFNLPGGRCERCERTGVLTINMHFLPGVQGRRFIRETLAVQYCGHDIARVLELTIEEALALFQEVPAARSRLQARSYVGPGGLPATTLSGGEAQRASGRALCLLHEPMTGLHLTDTARLPGGPPAPGRRRAERGGRTQPGYHAGRRPGHRSGARGWDGGRAARC